MAVHVQPRDAASPRPPRLPDRYRPVRPIAAGGMAVVWCAEDSLLGRRVAVKLLAEPFASDPAAVLRFKREARAAARLSAHPNVVTIFDVAETEPDEFGDVRPFMVMEHLSGGTVADALRVGETTLDEAVRWLHEAAGALDHAHARGVLHRDIKPANLLLDRHRTLHVADFGIAQIGSEDTITNPGHVLGTAGYLAPERALGHPATVASDLYALAVATFELLTGERPFTAASYLAQARQHLEEPPPRASERNPRLPPAIDAVLAQGMAKAPEQRWPSAEGFALAVERALARVSHPVDARAAAVSRGRRAVAARPSRRGAPPPSSRRLIPAAPAAAAATEHRMAAPAVVVTEHRMAAPTPGPAPTATRHRRPYALAGAAAVIVALVAGLAYGLSSGSDRAVRQAGTRAAASTKRNAAHGATSATATSSVAASTSAASAGQTSGTPAASTAQALETRGHALVIAGSYAAAVPVLREALAAAPPSSTTYAYAMYDLGRALTLSGHPQAAVPVLQQRLRIPNQTGVVRAALEQAKRAAAGDSSGSAPASPTPATAPSAAGPAAAGGRKSPSKGRSPNGQGPPGQLRKDRGAYTLPSNVSSGPPPMVPGGPDPSDD